MKKRLALLLALAMMVALVACGSSSGTTTTTTTDSTTSTEDDADTTEDDADTTEEDTDTTTDGYDIDASIGVTTITVATARSETDFVYLELKYLCDYVEANSNGTIEFVFYSGGTFCTMAEEFSYVSSGAVDMVALFEGTAASFIPLWQFSRMTQSLEDAVAVCNEILTNEETSAALYAEAEANNIHPLGGFVTGNTAFASTTPAETIADLCAGVYGTARSVAYFEALGLNTVSVENADLYESLSRGLIDSTSSTITGVISGKYYEVAPYILITEAQGLSGFPTINLDVWNSLTSEQQRLFEDAYAATMEWAIEQYNELFQGYQDTITEAGGTVYLMTAEDNLALMTAESQDVWDSYSSVAEAAGELDAFRTIMEYATELCGITIEMD